MNKVKLNDNFFSVTILIVSFQYLIFILPLNFITSSIGVILGVYLLKLGKIKEIYTKIIGQVFLYSIISYLIGLLFLYLIQYIYPFEIVSEVNGMGVVRNFIGFLASLIVGIFIFLFNRYITFKKINIESKTFLAFFIAIVSSPFLFLFPTNLVVKETSEYDYLIKYDGVFAGDASKVVSLIDVLDSGKYRETILLETKKDPIELVITYKDEIIFNEYKIMEKDSALLLRLISNLGIVTFNYGDKTYSFSTDYLNKIYNENIKEISIDNILQRYEKEYLNSEDYIYLGNVDGKYEIFDESFYCSDELEIIHEDDENNYLISCSQVDSIFVIDTESNKYTIKEILNNGIILPKDILKTNLKLHVEKKV